MSASKTIAAAQGGTRASDGFDAKNRLCYSFVTSKEDGIGVLFAPAAKAASTESAAFCFGARFMAAQSGSRKTRRFRSAGARYANLIGLPPRLASGLAVFTHCTPEAIMVNTPARRHAPRIAVIDGQPTTTSRDIAETFGKRHDHVLERIRKLDCSPEFSAPNFRAVDYTDAKGETRTEYRITRDGFAFLCMGFTGQRAAQWKERYINTFNRMAEQLAAKALPALAEPSYAMDASAAMALACTVTAEVQRTVFEALLKGQDASQLTRWLCTFSFAGGQHPTLRPTVQPVPMGAYVLTLPELAHNIAQGNTLATTAELAHLAAACNQRLAKRLAPPTNPGAQP